jgi:GH24 family phage-related lysozyme (muramidase)
MNGTEIVNGVLWVDPRLSRDIGVAEGDELTAYKDSQGLWTVGKGHLLSPQSHDWTGFKITAQQDEIYFNADIHDSVAFAMRLPEWQVSDTACRRNALVELCFNMRGRWLGFVLARKAWQNKDWAAAHTELLNSDWAHEVGSTRSNRIANYVLSGEYPAYVPLPEHLG